MDELMELEKPDPVMIAFAQEHYAVDEVVEQIGTWAVTHYGVECLTREYGIKKDRLYEGEPHHGWLYHMAGKRWVVIDDFAECLRAARGYHDPNGTMWLDRIKEQLKEYQRKPIMPTLRFEVLKRDGYRCQMCGATAKESRLHVDHRHPVAKGGKNDLKNLWTLCADCNHGKGTRPL